MIERTIYKQILHSIKLRPVTLITGARQVGKTTLCLKLRDELGFEYVSLRDKNDRSMARADPELFLQMHPAPLIVDEVQYAPALLESMESVIDRAVTEGKDNRGMFVVTGSQAYKLMEGISDSLAGRISILNMSPLSLSEMLGREEIPFSMSTTEAAKRSAEKTINASEFFERVLRGCYPEPEVEKELTTQEFYSDYVDTYIDRDAIANGTKYTFKIVAFGATGSSTLSRSVVIYRLSKAAISSVRSARTGEMTVAWKKNAAATGYYVQYSKNDSFTAAYKTVTVDDAAAVSKVLTGLTPGKNYYVRVRAFKTVGSKRYLSTWSAVKSVRVAN